MADETPTPPKAPRPRTVTSADAVTAALLADPPADPRVVRVTAHDAATGAELAAVSGPLAVFTAPGTWRVDGTHLPPPNPARTFRVGGPDGEQWHSTEAKLDGGSLLLTCERATGPGGDQ